MKGRNYRLSRGMPFCRREYMGGIPQCKIARFSTGQASNDYDIKLELTNQVRGQVRHNAIEAARVAANKKLVLIGESSYFLKVKLYPHIVLKENKMIATAGADRLQEGMRHAWGKPTGLAARVYAGKVMLEVHIMKENLSQAKDALRTAASKLPFTTTIVESLLKSDTPGDIVDDKDR